MAFPQNTLYLLIVAFTFYYPYYFLQNFSWLLIRYVHETCYIVPITKNKTGNTSDKNNYRPIALMTAASKNFEYVFLLF